MSSKYSYRVFDAHCDTITTIPEDCDLYNCPRDFSLEKAGQYSCFTQICAVFVDIGRHSVNERVDANIAKLYKNLELNPSVSLLKTPKDLSDHQTGVNIILSIEGGEAIGNSLARLRELYDKGVRLITLTWNTPYMISDTNCNVYDGNKSDKWSNILANNEGTYTGGLTTFGKSVLKCMNELGIVADVSHISEKGFYDVAEYSTKPFVASHSNSKKLCGHSRNLTDDQFKTLIRKRGVTGINMCADFLRLEGKSSVNIDTVIAHIDHFMSLGGQDNVGIGCDYDGIEHSPDGLKGTQDLHKLLDELLKRNYSEELVKKIASGNMERLFKEVL